MIDIPEDFELLGFFENEPIESALEDNLYVYEFIDNRGITLIFSFDYIEESVQLRLVTEGCNIATFSQEGVKKISIINDKLVSYLKLSFGLSESHTEASVQIRPHIAIKWSTLKSSTNQTGVRSLKNERNES